MTPSTVRRAAGRAYARGLASVVVILALSVCALIVCAIYLMEHELPWSRLLWGLVFLFWVYCTFSLVRSMS